MTSVLRNPNTLGVLSITNLLGLAGNTFLLRSHMKELSEDHEARMVCYSLTLLFLVISIVWGCMVPESFASWGMKWIFWYGLVPKLSGYPYQYPLLKYQMTALVACWWHFWCGGSRQLYPIRQPHLQYSDATTAGWARRNAPRSYWDHRRVARSIGGNGNRSRSRKEDVTLPAIRRYFLLETDISGRNEYYGKRARDEKGN
jgi:hypothetical protein